MQDVKITLGAENRITVDGQDLTDQVNFVGLEVELGQTLPVVTLGMKARVEIEGQTRVQVGTDRSPADMIASFLDSLDPNEVYDLAMEDDNLDGPGGVTAAILRAVKEKIDEWL